MKSQDNKPIVEKEKAISIAVLLITSIVIILLGTFLIIYSLLANVSFNVLSSNIHGSIFGLIISFLGVRYFLSVQKLKVEVYKSTSKFSWSNFKKEKPIKSLSRSK